MVKTSVKGHSGQSVVFVQLRRTKKCCHSFKAARYDADMTERLTMHKEDAGEDHPE